MRHLVTGGAGLIGSHIVEHLLNRGEQVCVIDDLSGASLRWIDKRIDGDNFFVYDLGNPKLAKDAVERFRPNYVWHLAANAREGASWFQPQNIAKRNFYAFVNVLEPAIGTGELKKFIFFSSMSVYGINQLPFTEDMKPSPEDPYGINKAMSEETLVMLAKLYEFDYIVIRPHNVFGERVFREDRYRNVISIFANKVLRDEPIVVYGDGNNTRAFSYIEDSVIGMIDIGLNCSNTTVNIGGEKVFTINEAADFVRCALGKPYHKIEHTRDRYREVPHAYSDHGRAKALINYRESIGAEEGIRRSCEFWAEEGPVEWEDVEPLVLSHEQLPDNWRYPEGKK